MDLPDGGYRPPPIHVCEDETYPIDVGPISGPGRHRIVIRLRTYRGRVVDYALQHEWCSGPDDDWRPCFGSTHVMVASTLTSTIETATVRPVPSKYWGGTTMPYWERLTKSHTSR